MHVSCLQRSRPPRRARVARDEPPQSWDDPALRGDEPDALPEWRNPRRPEPVPVSKVIGRRDVAIVVAGWTALALAAGVQGGLDAVLLGRAATWPASFRDAFLDWYSCALFIPILVVMVARWPLGRTSGPLAWAAYAAVVAACTVLKFVVWVPILHLLEPASKMSLLTYILGDFVFQFFAFSAVVGLLLSLVYYRLFRGPRDAPRSSRPRSRLRNSTRSASNCARTSSSTRSTASPRSSTSIPTPPTRCWGACPTCCA